MICVLATIETTAGRRGDLVAVFRGLVPQVRAAGVPRIRGDDRRPQRLRGPGTGP